MCNVSRHFGKICLQEADLQIQYGDTNMLFMLDTFMYSTMYVQATAKLFIIGYIQSEWFALLLSCIIEMLDASH